MPETVSELQELHALHRRAKAIRDRLASGPKTLAGREKVLAARRADLERAQKAVKDARAHNKNREVQLKQVEARIDDLNVKLNQARKQADYDAIRNQIAHDRVTQDRLEGEILEAFEAVERQVAAAGVLEGEVQALAAEVARLRADLEARTAPFRAQLAELEAAIAAAEAIIPEDSRDQYRRVVKQRGADAMAAVEDNACIGCNVSVTPQMVNELINRHSLVFCKTCGRILYLAEPDQPNLRRTERT